MTNEQSARRAGQIAEYASQDDVEAIVQVGLGADIEPISNMMVKLALMELSRGANSGISSLEKEFTMNYYIWANRRERHYSNWGNFTNSDGMPTIMRWYGMNISANEECTLCGKKEKLAVGETFMDSLRVMGSDNLEELSLPEEL